MGIPSMMHFGANTSEAKNIVKQCLEARRCRLVFHITVVSRAYLSWARLTIWNVLRIPFLCLKCTFLSTPSVLIPLRVDDRRTGLMQSLGIDAHCLENPIRSPAPSRKPREHILVRRYDWDRSAIAVGDYTVSAHKLGSRVPCISVVYVSGI